MRNVFLLLMAGGGAWLMAQGAVGVAASVAPQAVGAGVNPIAGLFVGPAILLGALGGALLASLVFPRC